MGFGTWSHAIERSEIEPAIQLEPLAPAPPSTGAGWNVGGVLQGANQISTLT